jgi:predicted N-formylglutamate amidohydrolase
LPALRQSALDVFEGVSGGMGENTPFAGTYVPLAHFRTTREVNSVMIEVRRDLYQEEPGVPKHGGYGRVVDRLARFLSAVNRSA